MLFVAVVSLGMFLVALLRFVRARRLSGEVMTDPVLRAACAPVPFALWFVARVSAVALGYRGVVHDSWFLLALVAAVLGGGILLRTSVRWWSRRMVLVFLLSAALWGSGVWFLVSVALTI